MTGQNRPRAIVPIFLRGNVRDNAPAGKRQRSKRLVPVATVLQGPGPLDRFNPVYEQVMLMAACN